MQSRIRSLASDTLIYGVFTVVGRFLTFFLTPIYSNYLTQIELGDVTIFFSIIAFLNITFALGMDSSFFRFYSKDDMAQTKKVFSTSYYTIGLMSVVISSLVFIFAENIAPTMSSLPNSVTLVRIAAFLPLLDSFLIIPMAMLRMTGKAKRFAWSRFAMIIVAFTLNIWFVIGFHWGAEGVFWAQLISSVFGIFLFLPDLYRFLVFKFDKSLTLQMLRFGFPTMPAALSGMVLQVADRPILKYLTTSDQSQQVAIYSVNYRLAIPMMLFVSIFEYAWKPFYLSRYNDPDAKQLFSRVFTYFTLISVVLFLVIGFYIEFIVRMPFIGGNFIKSDYWSGMGIIPIILFGYYFNGVFSNFAAGFHISKKTDYLPLVVGIAAIVNIAINFLTIPIWGIYGAAWATFIAYFVSSSLLFLISRKVYPIEYNWSKILMVLLLMCVVYFPIAFFTNNMNLGLSFIIRTFGIIAFVSALFYFKFFTASEIKSIRSLFKKK
jgi:O-antigen/teichoic acid export membrane protein